MSTPVACLLVEQRAAVKNQQSTSFEKQQPVNLGHSRSGLGAIDAHTRLGDYNEILRRPGIRCSERFRVWNTTVSVCVSYEEEGEKKMVVTLLRYILTYICETNRLCIGYV